MFRNMANYTDHPDNGEASEGTSYTHFGFRDVQVDEKAGLVRGVFDNVARRYDIMNDVMSAGMHRVWKNAMVETLNPRPGMHLLDVAGGTGDIAFRFLKQANSRRPGAAPAEVMVCDINNNMLEVGRNRAKLQDLDQHIEWVCGDAEHLPVNDGQFDAYTIAFGIRNVTNVQNALNEAYRALKPGGRFLCLEFSRVALPGLDKLYDAYSFNVIPALGQMIADDRESYQYLVESIRKFPTQTKFASMIEQAGFKRVSYRNMTGGVVALHTAWRI